MKIENCITESAYPVSVEWDGKDSNDINLYKVTIDDKTIFIDRDDWDKFNSFITNAMDFIDDNIDE